MASKLSINFNLGILGHVDSGKTTIAKLLSTQGSTAAFDKHPESQRRGITLDLGFSSLIVDAPESLKKQNDNQIETIQITFVDCPGHSSLIRTIIGGAQIIDMMMLVVDAQKGFQTQTSECLLIGELTCDKLFVVINKIDCLEDSERDKKLEKMKLKIAKILENTKFGRNVPIYSISALKSLHIEELLNGLKEFLFIPKRDSTKPFLFYVDHCFPIKGQGTVCTGTVIEGKVQINQNIAIPHLKEIRKVKSIQMFKKSVQTAIQGDRIGICVTQFNSDKMERGILCEPGYAQNIYAGIIKLNRIKYFRSTIKSKSKFHVTIGHETVMAKILLLKKQNTETNPETFTVTDEYEYIDELSDDLTAKEIDLIFLLLEFENSVLATSNSLIIASKLDMESDSNKCRIAFWGRLLLTSTSNRYREDEFKGLKIFRNKVKKGSVQRVVNDQEVIVQNLFKKESKNDYFIGKTVLLSTNEEGTIQSNFGKSGKIKITFEKPLCESTLEKLKYKNNDLVVTLNYKKYIFDKNKNITQ